MDSNDNIPIGIDLGTTFSCIGVYKNGGVEIIPNKEGERTTPSIITILDEDTILRGEEAMEYLVSKDDSTIYDIKRFIGRDLNNEKVRKELEKENFPFKIISNKKNNSSLIEIKKNNKIIQFTFEEISSFIIGKMVESAEEYLNKKVKKLVITVPANFNDAQRNCTKQAALLAGVEVIRIINEPTAAALAYGLHEKKEEINNKKVLVFDLGGGTFDVTILNINKYNGNFEQNYEILSTSGDKFLGGVDFDKVIADYFLERFCRINDLRIEDVRKDKKAMKKLKISCEKIKRNLSFSEEATLNIQNFYNNLDIFGPIWESRFYSLAEDLIKKIKDTLKDALNDAKITENEISEVVLVGGSSRLPMIKNLIKNLFSNCKINDSIDPDETVAVGATLMAAKILNKKDNFISGFNLMDITPLSLGVEVINEDKDDKIRKEGGIMNVIIKRGSKLPYINSKIYETIKDNQTTVHIIIYEGESHFVKYNNILGRVELTGLPKRPKGQVKIKIKFFIDVNGILTVTGSELDKDGNTDISIETNIKNDMVLLTEKQIERLRKKNEKYLKKRITFTHIRVTLKEFLNAYKESKIEGDKYDILINYNEVLEEYIDKFDKNFDNETMIEKYYFYIKELFFSYSKILNMKNQINEHIRIIDKINIYLNEFISKSFGYLENLIKTIENIPKQIFYGILFRIIEKLNENGEKCIKINVKDFTNNALLYFKKSIFFFKNYINNIDDLKGYFSQKDFDYFKRQITFTDDFFKLLNTNQIIFFKDSIKQKKLISYPDYKEKLLPINYFNLEYENKKIKIILENYEKNLSELNGKMNLEEALCLANIIKIKWNFIGNNDIKNLCRLIELCEAITKELGINEKDGNDWYKEFKDICDEIKDYMISIKKDEILEKYQSQFDELNEQFNNSNKYIQYILENFPYKQYEEDKNNSAINFTKYSEELIKYLIEKYNPKNYKFKIDDELTQLYYLLFEHIYYKLKNIF